MLFRLDHEVTELEAIRHRFKGKLEMVEGLRTAVRIFKFVRLP